MVIFTFSICWQETPFLGKFGPKFQNCLFKVKCLFGQIWSKKSELLVLAEFWQLFNSNLQNSLVVFPFSVFNWKNPFWVNLIQTIKTVSFNRNLMPRLSRICKIQWRWLFFLFQTVNTIFGQIWSKKSKLSL